MNDEAFCFFFDVAADFIKLCGHGVQAVTFFKANPAGVNDAGNPFGTRGQYGQDRHQIRAVWTSMTRPTRSDGQAVNSVLPRFGRPCRG